VAWPGTDGKVLLRGFVGGPHNQEIVKRPDEELVQTVLAEFRDILGLNPFAKPLFSRVFRWHRGMPQYTLGHLDRVTLIENHSIQTPGLAFAGGCFRGVGVPNCIESGERAVSKVLGEWGMDLSEDRVEENGIISRLLKNAHLRRCPHPSSLRRTSKYASLLRISGAP